jgi:esterase/lipase
MKTFVLIHGGWQSSWCWSKIKKPLEEMGCSVYNPDLPGHGQYQKNFCDISLSVYVDFVQSLIEKTEKKVILVGHSMAGAIISQIAENIPHKIESLVFISGFVLNDKASIHDEEKKSRYQNIKNHIIVNSGKSEIKIKCLKKMGDLFYEYCERKTKTQAINNLQSQPLKPFLNKISLSQERFGSVKKLYVECLFDQVVSIEDQRRMNKKIDSDNVLLKTDHSPFLSRSKDCFDILRGI